MRARRRQRERAIGIGVVLLGAVVLVVALFALREPKGHVTSETGTESTRTILSTVTHSAPRSSTKPRTTSSSPSSSSSSSSPSASPAGVKAVPLIVLNSTTIPNVAGDATRKLRSDGWTVTSFDSISNNIISTCAYYDPSVSGAKAAAQALRDQYPWIKRAEKRFPELPSGPVVVVLTAPYTQG